MKILKLLKIDCSAESNVDDFKVILFTVVGIAMLLGGLFTPEPFSSSIVFLGGFLFGKYFFGRKQH